MSRLIDTAPERIFLCVSDDLADINRPFPEVYQEDEAITWSTNNTVASSVCYVRADLHDEAMASLRMAKDACRLAREHKPIPWSFLEAKIESALEGDRK